MRKRSKKVNWAIVIAVIIAFLSPIWGQIVIGLFRYSEIRIDDVSPHTSIDGLPDYIEFKVANIGDKTTDFARFYYVKNNQTENTCGENVTFFNLSSPICNFERVGQINRYCNIQIPPLSDKSPAEIIKFYLHDEQFNFFSRLQNQTQCNLTESIWICSTDDKARGCKLVTVPIKFKS